MPVTINLTDTLAEKLQVRAGMQQISLEKLAVNILNKALEPADEDYPTPEEVVARIKATPPDPANIRPATGSLAEALQNAPDFPEFDLEAWEKEWAVVEREMKAVTGVSTSWGTH